MPEYRIYFVGQDDHFHGAQIIECAKRRRGGCVCLRPHRGLPSGRGVGAVQSPLAGSGRTAKPGSTQCADGIIRQFKSWAVSPQGELLKIRASNISLRIDNSGISIAALLGQSEPLPPHSSCPAELSEAEPPACRPSLHTDTQSSLRRPESSPSASLPGWSRDPTVAK